MDQSYDTAYANIDPFRLKAVVEIGPGAASNAANDVKREEDSKDVTHFSVDSARLCPVRRREFIFQFFFKTAYLCPRSELNRQRRSYVTCSGSAIEEDATNPR